MKALINAAKKTRNGLRDALLLLIIWRHGLRVSEACNLRLDDIDLQNGTIFVRCLKRSLSTTHLISSVELRALRKYLRVRKTSLPWLFISERNGQMTRGTINRLVDICAQRAGIKHHVTPHHLRHSCGYYLADKVTDIRVIADYLGHRSVQVTILYTRLSARQFDGLWKS